MNPVVHFEMPYTDSKRMSDFYTKTFGWESQVLGPEMGNYILVSTCEIDPVTHFPQKPGMINGGLFQKSNDNQHPSVVIAVDDIRESMKKIAEAGGKVLGASKPGEPDEIPGVGLYIAFTDTEGNRLSLLQPNKM